MLHSYAAVKFSKNNQFYNLDKIIVVLKFYIELDNAEKKVGHEKTVVRSHD